MGWSGGQEAGGGQGEAAGSLNGCDQTEQRKRMSLGEVKPDSSV